MYFTTTLKRIRGKLLYTFGILDSWFDAEQSLLHFRPAPDQWTIAEILEHISLVNYYLLLLINKGTSKALKAAARQSPAALLHQYRFRRDELEQISIPGSFIWPHPEHMTPAGFEPPNLVRNRIKQQVNQCLSCLEILKDGSGILYRTTMTVNALGKLDVYEYIYFLAMHAQRHIAQIEKNLALYEIINS